MLSDGDLLNVIMLRRENKEKYHNAHKKQKPTAEGNAACSSAPEPQEGLATANAASLEEPKCLCAQKHRMQCSCRASNLSFTMRETLVDRVPPVHTRGVSPRYDKRFPLPNVLESPCGVHAAVTIAPSLHLAVFASPVSRGSSRRASLREEEGFPQPSHAQQEKQQHEQTR